MDDEILDFDRRFDRRDFLVSGLKLGASVSAASSLLGAADSLAGVSAEAAPTSVRGGIVGNFYDSLADEWFVDETEGAKEAAHALGLSTQDFTFGTDSSKEIGLVQDAITRHVNMWAIYTPLGAGVSALAKRAKGHAVMCTEFDMQPWTYPSSYGDAWGFFLVNNIADGAYRAGKYVLNLIGGKGNVVVMSAFPGGQDNEGGEIGFNRALREFPQVKVLEKAPGHFSRQPAHNLMADWLSKHSKIDALLSYADTQSLGAYQAMRQVHRTNIKIASVNGQLEGLQGVKSGQITATVFNNPLYFGGWRTVRLFDLINGWKPHILERMMYIETSVVTQHNVDKYLAYANKRPLPYNWRKMSRVLHPKDWQSQARVHPINPVAFWNSPHNLGVKKPAQPWLPANAQRALNRGEFNTLYRLYDQHVGNAPV